MALVCDWTFLGRCVCVYCVCKCVWYVWLVCEREMKRETDAETDRSRETKKTKENGYGASFLISFTYSFNHQLLFFNVYFVLVTVLGTGKAESLFHLEITRRI